MTSAQVPFCHHIRGLGAAYIPALLEFQDPVAGVAYARLGPRFRGLWRQTAWPLCTSARSAVVLEGCHSMRFLETNCMASLHFGSLYCRARGMSLNGYLRSD